MTLLQYWRNRMHLSEEFTAGLIDCSLIEYKKIEAGTSQPNQEQSYMLERIFIIPTDALLSEVNPDHDERQIQEFLVFQQNIVK